ncbi:MAG: hypothetical protein EOP05_11755 [Proteobacteria bacterium]|nr:MAG: hypothetical protein EOP05_11755 [Pseudomonadota bacterium]
MTLILSPHYDDAIFSMGAEIARLSQTQKIIVATVFTNNAETSSRSQENLNAFAGLQNVELLDLGFTDAPLRSEIYRTGRGLLFDHQPECIEQVGKLVGTLSNLASMHQIGRIYAPFAVGEHVDHLITFAAAVEFVTAGSAVSADSGASLTFYVDQPYVEIPGALAARKDWVSGAVRNWKELSLTMFSGESFLAKLLTPEQQFELSNLDHADRFLESAPLELRKYVKRVSGPEIQDLRGRIKAYGSQEVFWPAWVQSGATQLQGLPLEETFLDLVTS